MTIGGLVLVGFLGHEVVPPFVGCNVKGNISFNGGQKIYHVPGQKYYWETRINWLKGERWFCSEGDALRAGWRKSGI
jgi:hypothetical protein